MLCHAHTHMHMQAGTNHEKKVKLLKIKKTHLFPPNHMVPFSIHTAFWRSWSKPSPCFRRTVTTAGGLPTLPNTHAKSNLSTDALPLVRSHDQVGDHEENVLPLRSQTEF